MLPLQSQITLATPSYTSEEDGYAGGAEHNKCSDVSALQIQEEEVKGTHSKSLLMMTCCNERVKEASTTCEMRHEEVYLMAMMKM